MSLKHNLLGLLAHKPSSGYSLHKRFFEPGRPKLTQIYRALNDMSNEGLIYSKKVGQKKRPARNIFHLTESGHTELENWIKDTSNISPIKEAVAQKLWYGSMSSTKHIIELLESFKASRNAELTYYKGNARKLEQKSLKSFGSPLDNLYWDLVLEYVQQRGKAELSWAENTIRIISTVNTDELRQFSKRRKRNPRQANSE